MTSGNNDPEEWRKIIGNKHHKDELAKKFKDNNSPMKIAIVVDMWLTGFDVPSLATMYVYKPMSGHNLMQAIARVNRVFSDKEGGLVVDYVGIASALKQAMNDYTSRDKKNYGDTDVAKVAYPKFLEKLSVCRDMFHGYDYSKFTGGTDLERAKTISGAVNFIMDREKADDKDSFVKEALMLHQALSLCSSLVDGESRFEAAFFESVRVLVLRLTNTGVGKKISLPEMNARINELLKQSIKSDGVINLFSDIKEEFSLFDPKFLEEVSNMKEKNLAVELLKKLIAEQVSVYRRTNVVKSEKFSEIMQRSLNAYLNGMLTNEEVIEEMLNLAKQIAAAQKEGDQLGLTADELAFYDALTKPQAIKDFYENEELIAITKELADTLRRNKTIDWQKRESARAKMRSDKLNNSKSFELGESNINIDLSKDAILVCAWNKERFVNALLNIGQNVGNLFEYDKINHMATYIYPIGLTIVYNGNHSTLSGILKGEGTIQANQTYDLVPTYDYMYFDGIYFRNKMNDEKLYKVARFEIGALYEIGRILAENGIR